MSLTPALRREARGRQISVSSWLKERRERGREEKKKVGRWRGLKRLTSQRPISDRCSGMLGVLSAGTAPAMGQRGPCICSPLVFEPHVLNGVLESEAMFWGP